MQCSRGNRRLWLPLSLISVGYPVLVYTAIDWVPPTVWGLLALALLGLRFLLLRNDDGMARVWQPVLIMVAGGVGGLLFWDPSLGARSYPVLVSLALAGVFGWSLRHPPTVIERIARLTEPDLSADGVAYVTTVTWIWFGFFLANAAVAGVLAGFASWEAWAFYTGFLSYLLVGLLWFGERLVRGRFRRREFTA